ncbi:TPA: hypothetical protein N0F65_005787 [Lagenidium giganteum]|uniref:F-box protein n=1 Tax=Lagenidium giganteum TaxID=4803 RepID=A0AAV2YTU6_9STRA|nr:TPA: hypothetical protein N0F65_005787 [Lagenidium giganteum]
MATALLTPAATAHVFELAAPVYDDIAAAHALHARAPHDPVVIPVTLRRTGDDWIALVFSSKPRNLRKDVSCVNDDCGCRCNFVRLLRGMLMLIETETLQVQAAYVLRAFSTPLATIRLHVELHPNAGDELSSLIDFDLVLSHLHPALMLELPDHDAAQPQRRVPGKLLTTGDVQKQLEAAALTPCHVVGCALHEFKDGQIRSVQYSRNGAKLRLSDVFKSLMVPLEAHRMEVRDDESYVKRMKRAKRQLILTDLPTTALQQVLSLVDARDLAALSGVCSMFQHMAYEIVPGLHLTLYRHQQRALKWMLFREASIRGDTKPMPHPFMLPATPDAALGKALDLVDMKVLNSATPGARDVHGGLLCDEPGLGKTITMLSLILRTKGQRSSIAALRARQAQAQQATSSRKLRSGHVRGRHVSHEELLESAASLIVVPDPLVEHWKYQIRMHTQRGCLKVFVDEDTVLPPPQVLAKCDIVITSLGRLAKEWRYHRPASVLETRMPDRYGFEGPQRYTDGSVRGELSSLLRIHWVRCIVDEGHKLGGTTESDHIRMSRMFSAEKRWVMTGTPTPNTLQSADLRYLHGLLVFLRDKPFGEQDGKAWVRAIARPFEDNEKIGLVRLHNLLSRIMLRHTKKSVRELLPDPIRRTVIVDPSIAEYNCYNIVAAAVRLNLVATKYDPNMPGAQHPDSLLNPKNRKFAREVIRNLRAGSNGGNETLIYLRAKDHVETVQMLSKFGVSQDLIAEVATYLRHATLNISTSCGCCLRDLVLLTLVPCGHLVCADCVDERMQSQGASCAVCEKNFNYELFQKVQPGFQFDFPKDDPKNLRIDPGQRQDPGNNSDSNNDSDSSNREDKGGDSNRKGDHPPPPSPPRPELQPEPARSRNRARNNSEADSNLVPDHRPREHRGERQPINLALHFAPVEASKAYYVAKRILELRDEYAKRRREGFWDRSPSAARYPKAIVFSQFREHIWRTKILFAQNGVPCTDFIALRSPEFRMQQLQKFRSDPEASVLLMMDVGSHGLDLSFVTHIFLLEEIWDKSLELQVISRAHRMGAKQSVVVGQLIAVMQNKRKKEVKGRHNNQNYQRNRHNQYNQYNQYNQLNQHHQHNQLNQHN